jgi:hypothetical protein
MHRTFTYHNTIIYVHLPQHKSSKQITIHRKVFSHIRKISLKYIDGRSCFEALVKTSAMAELDFELDARFQNYDI